MPFSTDLSVMDWTCVEVDGRSSPTISRGLSSSDVAVVTTTADAIALTDIAVTTSEVDDEEETGIEGNGWIVGGAGGCVRTGLVLIGPADTIAVGGVLTLGGTVGCVVTVGGTVALGVAWTVADVIGRILAVGVTRERTGAEFVGVAVGLTAAVGGTAVVTCVVDNSSLPDVTVVVDEGP